MDLWNGDENSPPFKTHKRDSHVKNEIFQPSATQIPLNVSMVRPKQARPEQYRP